MKRTCQELCSEALRRDSGDNVTILIASFHQREGFCWQHDDEANLEEQLHTRKGSRHDRPTHERPKFNFRDLAAALQDLE